MLLRGFLFRRAVAAALQELHQLLSGAARCCCRQTSQQPFLSKALLLVLHVCVVPTLVLLSENSARRPRDTQDAM
jgi:hypothetical protein